MDRIALAKRLESLSSVFAGHTPYSRDLKAMSYVLNKMADDKFKTIVSSDFTADVESCMCGAGPGAGPGMGPDIVPMGGPVPPEDGAKVIIIKKPMEEAAVMSAEATDKTAAEKTAGMYWSREASKAVVDGLLRDVVGMNKSICCDTGRQLETEQVPDGKHSGLPEIGVALKPEQTPDIAESLDSGIVNKSHGAVQKEASIEDIKKKKDETDKKKALKVLEGKKNKDATEQPVVEAAVAPVAVPVVVEATAVEPKTEEASSSSIFEGIELTASMDDVELDANEAAELSKLFQ